jgi:PAS domain S-box-containing protein
MSSPLDMFEHKYAASQQQMQELLEWADEARERGSMPPHLVEEISTAMEELHIAAEVMHEQSEHLARSQNELDQERRYYQELFDLAPDGYLVTDANGLIRRANEAAAELFHTRVKFLDGKPMTALICPEEYAHFRLWLNNVAKRGGRDHWEGRLTNRSGGFFHALLSVAVSRKPLGQVDHFRWLIRDLTERHRLDKELRDRAEQLERLNRAKDDFLAMLGHELRNPLVPLRNIAPILTKDSSPERIDWALGVLRRQVANMTRLVDDMLDASRLSRGKVQVRREPLNLARVVSAGAEDHRATLAENDVAVTVEVPDQPVPVLGDAARLAQVVNNLLHNAAKFTPPGGRITVRLEVKEGRAVVQVHDTGRGVPSDLLPHLFDAFVQGAGTLGGLGLGLPLVKGLIELHGGQVTVESEGADRGTAATFWLPLSEEPVPPSPGPVAPAARHCRVVVIDDNRDVAESLRYGLTSFGHSVETAYSGSDGVAAVRRLHPDVVVCDLGMAEMSGFAVARTLYQERTKAELRLIAYTGYGQEDISRRTQDAGFDLCLTKPLDLEQLHKAVSGLANNRKSR